MESGYLKRLLAVALMSFAAIPGISASDPAAGTDALTRARDYRDAGKIDDAIATYERSVELDPSLVDAWLELILLLTEVSQHRRALETSERAVRELPNEPKILARLVFQHGRLSRHAQRRVRLRRVPRSISHRMGNHRPGQRLSR
ncbi:MAG: tetratricopeptide repeat protein [Gammaproteobacteria bacterium]|nr:tetratricopeptide repeat protein [Gammaproteobacteria bacterium]